MQTIKLRSHVDSDGRLQLELNDLPADQKIEIILVYQPIKTKTDNASVQHEKDPIVGLFSGDSNLADQSEEILQQDIKKNAGWTWKQS